MRNNGTVRNRSILRDQVLEALYVKESARTVYIRAQGHITAALCSDLKARIFDRLEAKPPVDNVFVDLSLCDYMDSTFLGLLVGVNKRFLRYSERPLTVVRPSPPCLELLRTIGILRLVRVEDSTVPFPESMEIMVAAGRTDADLLLEVHESLMDLSEENRHRFSTLHDVLKKRAGDAGKDSD
ncbi:MAG TPA: STAS domain-containing protein [Magnetospirillaceae bacterium]|nr:STAS domain-containing protein [Magnetospirillaceae bacterium]